MIAYFPTPYPDELLYSQLARYNARTGHMTYKSTAEQLFVKSNTKINIRFVNRYTEEVLNLLTQTMPFSSIVEKYTMFPHFARFLPKARKIEVRRILVEMDERFYNVFRVMPLDAESYLRYCPLCAEKDREQYGETYWHREHQLLETDICAEHFCQLKNSGIRMSCKVAPVLITAEEIVSDSEKYSISENLMERQVAQYVSAVFQSALDMETEITANQFLRSRIEETRYVSQRGKKREGSLFYKCFHEYFKELGMTRIPTRNNVENVFRNKRFKVYDICLIAMFLEITVAELVNMKLPEQRQYQKFDATVKALYEQGMNYRQIAEQMQASYDVVKSIGEGNYGRKSGRA